MNLSIILVFIGSLTVTSYRSIPSQTDSSPWITSIGERVTVRGCAVSQDLLKEHGGPLDYGDLIYVDGFGFRFINDCMNQRHKNSIDLWVKTKDDESKVGVRKLKVYLVHPIKKES